MGHEIVGKVAAAGSGIPKFGDMVGVGCMIDPCGECMPCQHGEEDIVWDYKAGWLLI